MTSTSLSPRSFTRVFQRTFGAVFATLLWIQAAPAVRAETINYTPSIKTASVLSPDILVYPIDIKSPANTPTGTVTTVSFTTSATGAPIDLGTALGFFTVSPGTVAFTGPGQKQTILARLAIPAGTTPGIFVYKIKTIGFPAGNVDLGSTLNASVSEAPPDITTPTVTIVTPPDLSVYNPLASEMPLTIPFSFTAASDSQHPVLSVDASVAGIAVIPLTTSVDALGVTTAVGSLVISNPGTYTIQARAANEGGTSEVTSKFTVTVIAPKPTVAITAPAANAVFTYNAGTTPPAAQFNFTADSAFGVIRKMTADLDGVPVIFTASGLGTLHASGNTPDLALTAAGLYTLHVTAETDYGTSETSSQFRVNIVYPTPAIVIDAPANGSTVPLPPGAPSGSIGFQFTTTTTAGFNVSGTSASFDNGPAFTPNATGLGSGTAISSGSLANVGPGPHTLTVTGVSAGVSVSATSTFNVVLTGTPPAITSADHTTFTYAQAGTFTVTGTGLPLPTFNVTGALPAGVTFNGTAFTGTPTVTGSFPLTITATNGISPSATQAFTLSVPVRVLGVTAAPVKDYDGTTVATLNSGNTTLSGVIAGDTVTLNFSGVTATYNTKDVGTNKPVAVTGLALAGAQAGNYTIGTITAAGEIRQATPVITWPNPAAIVYGTKLSATQLNATASVAGSFVYAPALNALLDAGNQTLAVTFTPADAVNYKTIATTRPLLVQKADQIITFNALPTKTVGDAPFTLSATVDTNNPITFSSGTTSVATVSGATVTVVSAGTTVITASVAETTNYNAASATQTLTVQAGALAGAALVRHGITLNGQGGIDGSIQVLLPEGDTLNGNAFISGSLLVPGTPTIVANGHPIYVVADGAGAASPTNYSVTLNGNALIGKIVRRTDAIQMPVVAAPPSPAGTRSVTINSSKSSVGTWSTVKNLTLNGNVGTFAVPAGTYGNFIANGNNTAFQLGTPGSTTPAVYNFQNLTLNGNAELIIAGPVVITLANGVAFNGDVGTSDHPEWLTLKIASGGLTLNGNIDFSGFVVAPNGSVIQNGNGTLHGGVVCDRLTINGNGLLDLTP